MTMDKMTRIRFYKLSIVTTMFFFVAGCGSRPQLIRENSTGPEFAAKILPVFLESAINTASAEGPIVFKLASPIKLTDGRDLPKDSLVHGYYITDGNKVLFAPSTAEIKSEQGSAMIRINSNQTGRVAVTPTTARYLKEAGKGAAVGAGVGAISGGVIGGLEHGLVGALVGVAVGAAAGAAVGAGSSAVDVWLKGDQPVTLPAGSGIMVHLGEN